MPTDSEILDQAITNIEGVQRNLWTFRAMVKELGEIKTQYNQTKSSLEASKQQQDQLNAQLEAARVDLANIAKQRLEISKELSALNSQIAAKQTELQGLSNVREQIKAFLEAA
jgi:septal ring factor EnvC (AmiA/AmiB activator)